MTKSKPVSHWIDNYVDFLRSSLPYLKKAGLEAYSDDWDTFFEEMFKVFVVDRVGEEYCFWVEHDYGVWAEFDEKAALNSIGVTVKAGTPIFVGTTEGDRTIYRELVIETKCEFWFREFRYPFAEAGNMETHLNYVGGVSRVGRVCAPLEQCRFFVLSSDQEA